MLVATQLQREALKTPRLWKEEIFLLSPLFFFSPLPSFEGLNLTKAARPVPEQIGSLEGDQKPLEGRGSPQDLTNSCPWPTHTQGTVTPNLPRPLQARSIPRGMQRTGPSTGLEHPELFRDPGAGQQPHPRKPPPPSRLQPPRKPSGKGSGSLKWARNGVREEEPVHKARDRG